MRRSSSRSRSSRDEIYNPACCCLQSLLESRAQTAARGGASDTTADILLRMTRESMNNSFSQQKFGQGAPAFHIYNDFVAQPLAATGMTHSDELKLTQHQVLVSVLGRTFCAACEAPVK